jgi:MFS family permease
MIMTSVAAILAIVLLAFVSNPVMAYAAGFLKSLALPLETVMLPLIAADLFGRRSYAHMMGLIVSFNTLGYGVGNPLMNIFYDLTGTYKGIMLVLGGVMVLVAFAMQYCILCAHKIRKTQEAEEAQKEEAVC